MRAATAAGMASINIDAPMYTFPSAPAVALLERYRRFCRTVSRVKPRLSDNRLEAALYAPSPIQPNWIENTLRAVCKSISPTPEVTHDGRWLSQSVVNAATDFFQTTADLLPGEPFIYSSREGDLVAEFEGKHGTMTSIISSTSVLLFAVVDGVPIEPKIVETRRTREEVQVLTQSLLTGRDGDVETAQ